MAKFSRTQQNNSSDAKFRVGGDVAALEQLRCSSCNGGNPTVAQNCMWCGRSLRNNADCCGCAAEERGVSGVFGVSVWAPGYALFDCAGRHAYFLFECVFVIYYLWLRLAVHMDCGYGVGVDGGIIA